MACLQFSRVKLAVLLASCAPLASTCQQQWTRSKQQLPCIHIGQGKCLAGKHIKVSASNLWLLFPASQQYVELSCVLDS